MRSLLFFFLIILIASVLRFWGLNWSDVYEDELHYINDGVRLHNKDPYMSLRYHPFRHPEPSIGHPMLVQLISSVNYGVFQPTVSSARFPNAIFGVLVVGLVFLFNRNLGDKVHKLGALLLAIAPISVRYNRNAMLDSVFSFLLTAIAVVMWRYVNNPKRYLLFLAGTLAALSFSTKLDGVFGIFIIILTLIFCTPFSRSWQYFKDRLFDLVCVFSPLSIVFVILNDPLAYLDGIKNPTFDGWDFTSFAFWMDRLSLRSAASLFNVSLDLLGPAFVVLYIFAIIGIVRNIKDITSRFLVLWTISVSGVLLIHGFSVDSSYGWLTWTPPTTLTLAYFWKENTARHKKFLIFLMIIFTLPFTFFYGWRFVRLPEHGTDYNIVYNRIYTDNFYQTTVSAVNDLASFQAKILLLPQDFYPIFALRSDLKWSYSFDKNYDFYVLDKPVIDKIFFENNEYLGSIVSDQDNLHLERYVYKRQVL